MQWTVLGHNDLFVPTLILGIIFHYSFHHFQTHFYFLYFLHLSLDYLLQIYWVQFIIFIHSFNCQVSGAHNELAITLSDRKKKMISKNKNTPKSRWLHLEWGAGKTIKQSHKTMKLTITIKPEDTVIWKLIMRFGKIKKSFPKKVALVLKLEEWPGVILVQKGQTDDCVQVTGTGVARMYTNWSYS